MGVVERPGLLGVAGRRRFVEFDLTGAGAGQIFTEIQGRGFDADAALSTAKIEDLISSIATGGLLSPVLLEKMGERSYRLVVGERRLRAMRWGSINDSDNPNFARLAAVVIDGPISEEDRRWYQIIENQAREDLQPGELAAALLFGRSEVLASRLMLEGVPVADALANEDPVTRWEALDRARTGAGLHSVGAPWDEVIARMGFSVSANRAKGIVAAFRAMPPGLAADMDAAAVTLASRQAWVKLARGRQDAADEIWAALEGMGRPELLTRACDEALEHPDAGVDELVDLAAAVHDRTTTELDPEPASNDVDFGAGAMVGDGPEVDAGEALEVLAGLVSSLRSGGRLRGYDAGSLRLRCREITELLNRAPAAGELVNSELVEGELVGGPV